MLGVNTIDFFLKNLQENRVLFPEERNALVLDHQHCLRDVTCANQQYERVGKSFIQVFDVAR